MEFRSIRIFFDISGYQDLELSVHKFISAHHVFCIAIVMTKDAFLQIRVDSTLKEAFKSVCEAKHVSMTNFISGLIYDEVAEFVEKRMLKAAEQDSGPSLQPRPQIERTEVQTV